MSSVAENVLEQMIQSGQEDPEVIQGLLDQIEAESKAKELETEQKESNLKASEVEDWSMVKIEMDKDIVQMDIERAYEEVPQFFTPINMTYIHCQIGEELISAFVDTGAQVTVMNLETAIKCGLSHRIDTRNKIMVKGVGTQESVGTIYGVDMIIGKYSFMCNFVVMRNAPNVMVGLNMMRTHGIILDYSKKILKVSDQDIPFLTDKEIHTDMFNKSLGTK